MFALSTQPAQGGHKRNVMEDPAETREKAALLDPSANKDTYMHIYIYMHI